MKKVLICDDEPNLRLLYETELRRKGFAAASVANAEQCLRHVMHMKPDIVVLDIRMPGIDGIDLLNRIRERNPALPIVFNTAYSSYRQDFRTWAANAILTKSADVSQLVETIEKLT